MSQKQVQLDEGNLPEGTRAALHRDGGDMTFAMPAGEDGWIALLRFTARDCGVDLVAFEVTYYSPPEMPEPGQGWADLLAAEQDPKMRDDGIANWNDRNFREWVQERAGRPAPIGVPAGGLTLRRLRGIRMADFQTVARSYLSTQSSPGGWLGERWATEAVRRPGPKGRDDLHFAELAAAYIRHLDQGHKPIEALASEQFLSKTTIRNKISSARKRGLLTATPQGVAGGRLTPKAIELLKEIET